MTPEELETRISELVAQCHAAQEGYHRAAEILFDQPEVVHFFDEQAQARNRAAQALENRLAQTRGHLKPQELLSPPSEGWSWPAAEDTTPEAVIASCHRGEEREVQAYAQLLDDFTGEWRWEVRQQFEAARSALSKLHTWMEGKEVQPTRG